jgi:hypothetical protein
MLRPSLPGRQLWLASRFSPFSYMQNISVAYCKPGSWGDSRSWLSPVFSSDPAL